MTSFYTFFRTIHTLAMASTIVFFAAAAFAADEKSSDKTTRPSSTVKFFPNIGFALESQYYAPNKLDYSFYTRRTINMDVVRAGNYVFSINGKEQNFFEGLNDRWFKPFRVQYYIQFGDIRREFENGSLSIYMDHTCNNIVDTYSMTGPIEKYQLGWYRYGAKWESRGYRIGYKNRRINFDSADAVSFLGNIDYQITAGKCITSDYGFYKAIATGSMRIDLLRIYNVVPYIEGELFGTWDWKFKADADAEAGTRIHFDNVDIVPYAHFKYYHNANYYDGMTTHLTSFGLRLETLLGDDAATGTKAAATAKETPSTDGSFYSPRINGLVQYRKYLSSDYVNFNALFVSQIDLFRIKGFTPFIAAVFQHDSPVNENPWPRYIRYKLEGGLEYYFNENKYLAETSFKYTSRNEANYYKGYQERYQSACLRLMSSDMKSGHANDRIGESTDGFRWLKNIGWLAGAEYTVNDTNYKYKYQFDAKLRWDILEWSGYIPYIMPSVTMFHSSVYNDHYRYEFSAESGIRINQRIPFTLYYCFMRRIDIDYAGGIREYQNTAGVRAEF